MPPPVRSKCRQVDALEGDTWCLGCSAWEALGRELTGHWSVPGARLLASDLVVSCTRQVRAIRGFSAGLAQRSEASSGAGGDRASAGLTTAAKSLPRAPSGTRKLPTPPPAPPCKAEESYDEDEVEETEGSEEEAGAPGPVAPLGGSGDRRPPEPDHPPSGRHPHHPRSTTGAEKTRDSHRRHRAREGRGDHRSSDQKRRKRPSTRRAGRKHKRLHRLVENPLLPVHRLQGDSLWELGSVQYGREALDRA